MNRIAMKTPLVEMNGDEMTRILWDKIKNELLLPFVDLKTEEYDLGLHKREETKDRITLDAAEAVRRLGVGVKCATITPNADRMSEYNLTEMWKSPNGTIRAALDGTTFRTPITVKNLRPLVPTWTKPITVARHSYGDVYANREIRVETPATAWLVAEYADGRREEQEIAVLNGPGVLQGVHNRDDSIEHFAHACFRYALSLKQDLWFATKDTISKIYDRVFKETFERVFQEYEKDFEAAGIEYMYTLIDDAVARVMRSEGGMIWACKNYDGDVMSDMVATAFGSLAMMTSVLVAPDGSFNYEAAHGTVQRHYYQHLEGKETSTNPIATIFAWTGALRKRGELDELPALVDFAEALEKATLQTVEEGIMTKDLVSQCTGNATAVNSDAFLAEIRKRLETAVHA